MEAFGVDIGPFGFRLDRLDLTKKGASDSPPAVALSRVVTNLELRHCTVEAPTWIGVDRIDLLENGVVIDSFEPADPNRGDGARPAVRFDGTFSASPVTDAWYAIEVFGSGGLSPVELDDEPYALTNAIEVDADGDGVWSPPGNAAP